MKHIHSIGHSARTALATTALALLAGAWNADAQFEITTPTGNAAQDFDTLITTGTNQPWLNDVTVGTGGSNTLDGWSLFTSANLAIAAYDSGTGSSGTGKFYSFGLAAATERSLGGVGSGGGYFGGPANGALAGSIAFAATNNSASTLTAFTLGFDGEQWRNGGNTTAQSMVLEYGFGATFSAVSWTAPGGNFNWTSPVATGTAAAVDGNVAGLQAGRGGTINGLTWIAGDTLWIRWKEVNDAGNDHGLAIDNFTLSWLAATPPKALIWSPGTTAWNTTATNWVDNVPNTVAFANGDSVTFGNTGVGIVDIDAGGVSPSVTTVSHTAGTYTFQGGPINGTGALNKTGDGTLVLAGANAFTGGVNLDAGTIEVSNDNQLGGIGGGLTYGGITGGTLRTVTSGITSSRTIFVLAGSKIDTNSLNSSFSGPVSVTDGTFTKAGAGDLRLSGTFSMSGSSRISVTGGTLTLVQLAGQLTNVGLDVLNGDVILETALRLNVNRGTTSGAGKIRTLVSDTAISQSGSALTATINNEIVLNSNNVAAPFLTHFGTTFGNALTINGVISGNSDVNISSSAVTGSGAGVLTLNAANTYTGATTINSSAGGIVRLGVDNALPTGTALTFGTQTGAGPGGLDLNGHNQTISSLSFGGIGAAASARIVNDSATADSILTISGSVTPANPFSGKIADGAGGFKVTVVKDGTNTITLNGVTEFSTLKVIGGTLNLNAALNTLAGSTIDVTPAGGTANLNVGADQTVASITIGAGGVLTVTPPASPLEEFFPGEGGGAPGFDDLAGSAGAPVPEPVAGMLLLGGLASLAGFRRRR